MSVLRRLSHSSTTWLDRVIWIGAVLFAVLLCGSALSDPTDELQKWIDENAVAVRSIDSADQDFTDLEPLIDAIGSAEVVQLGEPSHGAGNSFSAKVRLIKFLHQRMGFDVLIWESGMHGMRLAQAGMRTEEDPVSAAQQGIFTIWSDTEQVKPLLEYVKASQSSTRPLEMAGYDLQFTAHKAFERFAADLRSFVSAVREPAIRSRSQQLAEEALRSYEHLCCAFKDARASKYAELTSTGTSGDDLAKAMATWEKQKGPELQPTKRELDALQNATRSLLATIDGHRALFEQVHGAKETSFMEQAIENISADGAGKLDIDHGASGGTHASVRNVVSYFNRRDEQNARNLRRLLEKGYPGRKVIVWAHNAHVTYAHFAPGFAAVHLAAHPEDMKPTGAYLYEWLGNKVYTIGFTTYQGNDGWATGSVVTAVPPAPVGSLESRLHALGIPHIFLDARAPSANPRHPLRRPLSMRVLIPAPGSNTAAPAHGNYTVDDITRVFDGIFYIDETTPATRL